MLRRRIAPFALLTILGFTACKAEEKPKPEEAGEKGPKEPADKNEPERRTTPDATNLPKLPPPTVDTAPVSDLQGVVATVQLPTGSAISDLAAIADSFKAGSSTMLKVQVPMMLGEIAGMSLDGAKLDGPISIIVVDPIKHPQPAALLVEVADLAKLQATAKTASKEVREKDGRALIGSAEVVAAAEAFAFANMLTQPDHSEIVIYPAPLVAALGPKIDEALAAFPTTGTTGMEGMLAGVMQGYAKMLRGIADQTQRIVISASAGQDVSEMHMRLYPVPGSQFAGFVAAQNPADHALLAKLPAGTGGTAIISAELHAGPVMEPMLAFGVEAMRAMYQSELTTEEWMKLFQDWMATLDGKMVAAIDMTIATPAPTMRMTSLFGSTDSTAMRTAWRNMMSAITKGGGLMGMIGMTLEFKQAALEHDGVEIDLYSSKMDLSKLPPESQASMQASANQTMHLAAFDSFGAIASAGGDQAAITSIIDAARGKGETFQLQDGFARALEASKARGDSMIYWFDLSRLVPANAGAQIPFTAMVMSMGKQGDVLDFTIGFQK